MDSSGDRYKLINALEQDYRFTKISNTYNNNPIFITQEALFKKLCFFSYRLSLANICKMSINTFAKYFGCLFLNLTLNEITCEVTEFGRKYNFIANSINDKVFIFPISRFLRFVNANLKEHYLDYMLKLSNENLRTLTLLHSLPYWTRLGMKWSDHRSKFILLSREGILSHSRENLENLGKKFNITRERARQIEVKSRIIINRSQNSKYFLYGLIGHFLKSRIPLLLNSQSPECKLILFLSKCLNLPWFEVPNTNLIILAVTEKEFSLPMPKKSNDFLIDKKEIITSFNNLRSVLTEDEAIIVSNEFSKAVKVPILRERVYISLLKLGRPSHYTVITDKHNELFPNNSSNENSVHSTLVNGHGQLGFIWIGKHGTYGLKEWGYEKPDPYFDTVKEIVQKAYERNKKPVHSNYILSELCKIRKVYNPNSIQAAIFANQYIKQVSKEFFIPISESHTNCDSDEESIDNALREFEKGLSKDTE